MLGAGPSKMLVEATCMWAPARSMCRNEESSPLSLSALTRAIFAHDRRAPAQADDFSGGHAELQLIAFLLGRNRLRYLTFERGNPHAKQAHRPGRVIGAQEVEGD